MSPPEVKTLRRRKLTHLLGTGLDRPDGRGSWIGYWRQTTGHSAPVCCEINCAQAGSTGAHVKLTGSDLKAAAAKWRWWLVPCCQRHNPSGSHAHFTCKPGTMAVEVDVSLITRATTWPADLRCLFS